MSRSPALAEQFEELSQQHLADQLGMWIFLATEVMFFGGLIACYTVYRFLTPEVFAHASHHLGLVLGGVNTAVLLCSSLTMALAVRSIQLGRRGATVGLLLVTCLLGLAFLGIKGYEYHEKFAEHLIPGRSFHYDGPSPARAQMFFWLYFAMTGLHGLHVLIGVGLLFTIAVLTWRGRVNRERYMAVEVSGLYWHFVDIVWVFLYPLLYLAGARA
jgi:cytochrome c oxidase subunit 3